MGYRRPEPLEQHHLVDDFTSEEPALDDWLKRHARAAHQGGSARVYVTTTEAAPNVVVGYFALSAASLDPAEAPARALKGQARRRPIPAILLARLARDLRHKGEGLGRSLLQDALLRATQAADVVGARLLIVHAKHERAMTFYLRYGFVPSPSDPRHLLMLMKDVRASLKG